MNSPALAGDCSINELVGGVYEAIFFITACIISFFSSLATAETLNGKWNYSGYGTVTLINNSENSYTLIWEFIDGSRLDEKLIKNEDEYISLTIRGQWYEIDNKGNLKVFDGEGIVKTLPSM